ncbi:MAG: glycosyltransferase family 2 protein [Candidatus Pacebacteria bacterium]|nr:glycosyltransferase family 2 protein [Candidatus Paceibacterota bacterium]
MSKPIRNQSLFKKPKASAEKNKKLAVMIPCLNEASSLGRVLASIPKRIKGIGRIEVVVIDDGSTDQTRTIAEKAGIKHLVIHKKNQGLAKSFEDGLAKALTIGADIIVNTDGDNQYNQSQISQLVQPILKDRADLVLGNRQIRKLKHMPIAKKWGNLLGSWTIRKLTGTKIRDASTGFRAFSRELASSFGCFLGHTYTHESIIHAALNDFRIIEIPITFKKRQFGHSRLIKNIWTHIKTSGAIIVRTILVYRAFKYLSLLGLVLILSGIFGIGRFLFFYFAGKGNGHIQSLILASILIGTGFSTFLMGILADLIGLNRKLINKLGQSLK